MRSKEESDLCHIIKITFGFFLSDPIYNKETSASLYNKTYLWNFLSRSMYNKE